MLVYTVGYSGFDLPEMVEALASRGVEVVVDVRRFPRSRLGFSKEALEAALEARGLEYRWMGELGALGVRGPGAGCASSRTFDAYVWRLYRFAPALFQLEELFRLASKRRVALLCREEDWRRCHRQFIADFLVSRGLEVVHIRRRGEERHEPTGCFGKLSPPPLAIVERALRDFSRLCDRGSVYLFGGSLHGGGGDVDVVVYGVGRADELPPGYDAQFIPAPEPDLFHLFVTRGVLLCGRPLVVDPRSVLRRELEEAEDLAEYFASGSNPVLVCKAAKRLVFLAAVLHCGLDADTWHKATACLRGRGVEVPSAFKNCLGPPPLEELRRHSSVVKALLALVREAGRAL